MAQSPTTLPTGQRVAPPAQPSTPGVILPPPPPGLLGLLAAKERARRLALKDQFGDYYAPPQAIESLDEDSKRALRAMISAR